MSRITCVHCGASFSSTENAVGTLKQSQSESSGLGHIPMHADEPRLNIWVYVGSWFILSLLFGFVFRASANSDFTIYAAMGCSFVCIYIVYTKIEYGKASLSDALRYLVAFVVLALGTGVFMVPFWFLDGEGTFAHILLEVVAVYLGGTLLVVGLLTILCWMNDSSPSQEFKKCFRLM